ncbi:MAG TPA: nickel pincer cofactor biosynthesis protein LarC [Clostridiaceae bacterium]|nr:nickel pincer cofactor biosynthesis protein LarC [Clostridiaceae bacterium]
MKVLYFDCFSGISGDMTLGALLDLGIDSELFKSELKKLNLSGYDIVIQKKSINGIYGTDVQVLIYKDDNAGSHDHGYNNGGKHGDHHTGSHCSGNEHYHEHYHEHSHEHHHGQNHEHSHEHNHDHHDHSHEHLHGHNHEHHYEHNHEHKHHDHKNHRNLKTIEELIDESGLKHSVKELSKKVFREIAKAEAKVHNKDINEIHFHEVGAVDSIIDIVGTAICIDLLGIDKVYSSPLHDGRGFITCAHGIIPVPVPAVMEMLSGTNIPLITEDVDTELITPTGMGLIKCLASDFGNMPAMFIDRIGYGMGKRKTGRFNALRVIMGTIPHENMMMEEMALLETNIDDMSPEIMGYTIEKLLKSGALDAFYTPVYMKKNRPAVMLSVLCEPEKEKELVEIIMKETSTLGVRRKVINRYCMDRKVKTVNTQYGDVRVKVASWGNFSKVSAEYEDCRHIAEKTGIPLRDVYDMVMKHIEK